MWYKFTIAHEPTPWKAPNVRNRCFFDRRCHEKRAITSLMKTVWDDNYGEDPIDCPIQLSMVFVRPIPLSWSEKKKEKAKKGMVLAAVRPDYGNYAKLTEDCLKAAGIIKDDAQVVIGTAIKLYGEKPCIYVSFKKIKTIHDIEGLELLGVKL